ncbi:unnamed protein product [Cuscuta campestris]|uniref:Uncharacterized protein n=1 Tax=Cuscuta campestris TaxID=132261 RepID=A0A484KKR5_9ASTE|nr:unnamed protein product [Cuscuta campestris]
MTCLRKPLGGRPAGGGPRMTDPAVAECVQLPRWSFLVLCLGPAKWALAKLGWAVFLLGWILPFPVGAREGNSYVVVSSQAECGMAVIPTSLKLWKAKFVFISSFPGDRHPFQARFPDYHTFIRHPRPEATPDLLAHAQKLLDDCWPKPPHVYTVCTKQNLAEVGILISLERQFKLTEAVLGSRPKHGLEESTSRPGDRVSEGEEEEEDEEVETDEELGQPSYSEGTADVEPSGGDMHPLEVIHKAKLLAQNRSREEEVQQEPPSGGTSGSAAVVPNREVIPTWNQRKRKLIQVEEEETASKQDTVPTQIPLSQRPTGPQDGKCPTSLDRTDGDVQAKAEVASLSATLKDEDEILSSLQGLVDGFYKKASAKLSLISKCRVGAEFSSGVDFLASVETELSRLRKLAEAEHEQATELKMQAVAKSEEVVRLQGLLKESEESASQLTTSMAELEGRLRQSEGRILEMDVDLAEAVSAQRSLEAGRDRALAEKEQVAAEKERAVSDFLQSPAFKDACLEKMVDYYESWLGNEAGIKKMGEEGKKWFGVYHEIQLVLRRTRRVDPSFPLPGVVIPDMHYLTTGPSHCFTHVSLQTIPTSINATAHLPYLFAFGPINWPSTCVVRPSLPYGNCANIPMASNNPKENVPSSSHSKAGRRPPPSPPKDAKSRTCSWWYRAKRLERRIERLQRLTNYLHGVPQRPAPSVEVAQPAADAIPADSILPSFATAPTAVGICVDPDLPSLSEESVQGPLCHEPAMAEVSKRSGRLVRKVGTNVRAYLEGFRRAHRKKTANTTLKTKFVTDHDTSSVDSSLSKEMGFLLRSHPQQGGERCVLSRTKGRGRHPKQDCKFSVLSRTLRCSLCYQQVVPIRTLFFVSFRVPIPRVKPCRWAPP